METNFKINSKYYQEEVLCPIFTKKIPFYNPNVFHRVKLNKGNKIHTSKSTIALLEKMKIDVSIECIPFQHIPANNEYLKE